MWLRSIAVQTHAELPSAIDGVLAADRPRFALCFADPKHDLGMLTAKIWRHIDAPCLGASTAGELTERGLQRGGIVVALIGGDDFRLETAKDRDIRERADEAAAAMTVGFAKSTRRHALDGFGHTSTLLLTNGLAGGGEELALALHRHTRPHQQIVGGAAGDAGRFRRTEVALDGVAVANGAVAVHLFSRAPLGIGLGTGLRPASPRYVVTRSEGARVFELDGLPVLDVYETFARNTGRVFDRDAPGTFFVTHELGIHFFDELRFARAPLMAMDDGSLVCAAAVPVGSTVCILDGCAPDLVEAAAEASREAHENLGRRCGGVLAFDCVCRGLMLKEAFSDEIAAIRSALHTDALAGFLTYGEIARYRGQRQGWHNATAVVVALPACDDAPA